MPEVPQYQTKFAGRSQSKFTPTGFQVPNIFPATSAEKTVEGLSQIATQTVMGALKEKETFARQQQITQETNELMSDMSSFMTNLEENATNLREGNEPWSEVYGREWEKKTEELQSKIDSMPPGKAKDTIQNYFAEDVGKRSVVIASSAEQREDRDFVDDIRANISMATKIGGEEGLDLLQATMENAQEKEHLFAKETLLDLQYTAASELAKDQKFNLIVTYDQEGRAHFNFNIEDKDVSTRADVEVSNAQINKMNARATPVPSLLDTSPKNITKKQIDSAPPELVDMYLEHHYSSLVANVDSWPEKLKAHDGGSFYNRALRTAEMQEWNKLDNATIENLKDIFKTYYTPEELGEHRRTLRPDKLRELKSLYRELKVVEGLELNEIEERLKKLVTEKQGGEDE